MTPTEAAKKISEEMHIRYLLTDDPIDVAIFHEVSRIFKRFAELLEGYDES